MKRSKMTLNKSCNYINYSNQKVNYRAVPKIIYIYINCTTFLAARTQNSKNPNSKAKLPE